MRDVNETGYKYNDMYGGKFPHIIAKTKWGAAYIMGASNSYEPVKMKHRKLMLLKLSSQNSAAYINRCRHHLIFL